MRGVVEAFPIAAGDAPDSNPLSPAGDAASRIHLSSSLPHGYPANFRFVKAFATKVEALPKLFGKYRL
jgi:hypothetical protein